MLNLSVKSGPQAKIGEPINFAEDSSASVSSQQGRRYLRAIPLTRLALDESTVALLATHIDETFSCFMLPAARCREHKRPSSPGVHIAGLVGIIPVDSIFSSRT